jgi:hypothetical protein
MSSASFDVASERLLASMAVHVRLDIARSSEALVANLALVLLLSVGREL